MISGLGETINNYGFIKEQLKSFSYGAMFLIVLFGAASSAEFAVAADWPELQAHNTYSHLEFLVGSPDAYTIESSKNGRTLLLQVQIANGDAGDLKAIKQRTDAINAKLKETKDGRVERIDFVERQSTDPLNNRPLEFEIKLKPGNKVDHFAYFDKATSRLKMDFWVDGKTTSKLNVNAAVDTAKSLKSKPQPMAVVKTARPSNQYICQEKLDFDRDPFLSYGVLHSRFDFKKFFNIDSPESGYVYPLLDLTEAPVDTIKPRELAHYRLMHRLRKAKKYGLALRSMEFYQKEFPKSTLRREVDFLRANIFLELAHQLKSDAFKEKANDQLRKILRQGFASKSLDDQRGPQVLAYFFQQAFDRIDQGAKLEILDLALQGAQLQFSNDDKRVLWPLAFRLVSAEILLSLGEYDRAERAYQAVVESNTVLSMEASYRMGEVYSSRKFWERAILSYERAIRQFPVSRVLAERIGILDESGKVTKSKNSLVGESVPRHLLSMLAVTLFNRAEAYFQMGRYQTAQEAYIDYLQYAGGHSYEWAAKLRLVEMQHLAFDKTLMAKGLPDPAKAYELLINRHPYTLGAHFAQMRLSRCYVDNNQLEPKQRETQENYYQLFYDRLSEVTLEDPFLLASDIKTYRDVHEILVRIWSNDYKKTLKFVDDYRLRLKSFKFGQVIKEAFARAVAGRMQELIVAKDYKGAIQFGDQYADLFSSDDKANITAQYALANLKLGKVDAAIQLISELDSSDANQKKLNNIAKSIYYYVKFKVTDMGVSNIGLLSSWASNVIEPVENRIEVYAALAERAYEGKEDRVLLSSTEELLALVLKQNPSAANAKIGLMAHVHRIKLHFKERKYDVVLKEFEQMQLRFGVWFEGSGTKDRILYQLVRSYFELGKFGEVLKLTEDDASYSELNAPVIAEIKFIQSKSLLRLGKRTQATESFRKLASIEAKDSGQETWKKSAQAELEQIQWEDKQSAIEKR